MLKNETVFNPLAIYKEIQNNYTKDAIENNRIISNENFRLFIEMIHSCINELKKYQKITLISKVQRKRYFAYTNGKQKSRPINFDLYVENEKEIITFIWSAVRFNNYKKYSPNDITKYCYTIVVNFCAIVDINKKDDRQTPGKFFEYFISFIMGKKFDVENPNSPISPKKDIEVLNLDRNSKLTIDFYFDLGINKPKFHLPVKTSTRERIIQVWAHQRIIDGVYGLGRFFGIPVILAETKLDSRSLEVIEICVPDQWRIYQMFIAQLKRIYYLDIPNIYRSLNENYPKIYVKQFGEFFYEYNNICD
jgi:hypothetical protein